jgi:hypothetical protein
MPVARNRNPLAPRTKAQTQAANEARWKDHVQPTQEELLSRKERYRQRAKEKRDQNKPASEPEPVNEPEVKVDESLDVSEKVVRRKPRPDRINGVLTKTLEAERKFSSPARIRELEKLCKLEPGEPTSVRRAIYSSSSRDRD